MRGRWRGWQRQGLAAAGLSARETEVLRLLAFGQTDEGAAHATRATYRDGKMDGEGGKPCAGVRGTTISVEDLFYNVVTRRKALKSASEEYSKVLEVLQRYAALRTDVAFTCRKHGESRPTLHAPVVESRVERLQGIYGPAVARDLKTLELDTELSKKKFEFKKFMFTKKFL